MSRMVATSGRAKFHLSRMSTFCRLPRAASLAGETVFNQKSVAFRSAETCAPRSPAHRSPIRQTPCCHPAKKTWISNANIVSSIKPRPPDVTRFHLSRYQHGTNQTNDHYQEYINVALFGPDCQAFPSSSVLYREQVTDADFRVQIASRTRKQNRRSPHN